MKRESFFCFRFFLVLFPLLIIFFVSVHLLPPDVAWSFKMCEKEIDSWDFRGTNSLGYRFKSFLPESKEYEKVRDLFHGQLLGSEKDSNSTLEIEEVVSVYNPVLVTNFINTWVILKERIKNSANIFANAKWAGENKTVIMDSYHTLAKRFSWNQEGELVPIIASCHGTDLPIAEKICETGFAALSSLDDGWYGKGIYFTCEGLYTLPYIKNRRIPTILISYIIPGHVFPVTEEKSADGSLIGKPIMAGYNSHFVGVNRNGTIWNSSDGKLYDEIVIPQEGQIMPAFLVKINPHNFSKLFKIWKRAIPKFEATTLRSDENIIVKMDR